MFLPCCFEFKGSEIPNYLSQKIRAIDSQLRPIFKGTGMWIPRTRKINSERFKWLTKTRLWYSLKAVNMNSRKAEERLMDVTLRRRWELAFLGPGPGVMHTMKHLTRVCCFCLHRNRICVHCLQINKVILRAYPIFIDNFYSSKKNYCKALQFDDLLE